MKIKKAVDKAKQMRAEEGLLLDDGVDFAFDEEPRDWKAPVYKESRTVLLDPEVLRRNRCVSPDSREIAYYKVLRTQINQIIRQRGMRTIMITSPRPGEGKTLTSVNLAITFAREFNQTVLLMDCDLMRQNVHKTLGYASQLSLADYLVDGVPLKEIIVWPGIDKLTVISGIRTCHDSTEYLDSPRMKSLVGEVKNRYSDRCIFFDVPPLSGNADAMAFAPQVDGIIMVVESGHTTKAEVRKAISMLPKEKFIGFILNKENCELDSYGYGY